MRIALLIEYDGSAYHGWQLQPNNSSVQETVELALERVLAQKVRIHGSGRTDSGVHAKGQVAHFDIEVSRVPPVKISSALKRELPDDILVKASCEVSDEFHARFDACKRHYRYSISLEQNVLKRQQSWSPGYSMDITRLEACADLLPGKHDFSSFCQAGTDTENFICDVSRAEWVQVEDVLVFHISADRFLHHMVRMLTGSMVEVARGKWELEEFKERLASPDLRSSTITAPPQGLVLERVDYPDSIQLAW